MDYHPTLNTLNDPSFNRERPRGWVITAGIGWGRNSGTHKPLLQFKSKCSFFFLLNTDGVSVEVSEIKV